MNMKEVYLAYSGDINKHGHQDYKLIGVFQDKDMAIQAIEESMSDCDMEFVERGSTSDGTIIWTEAGMEYVDVGMLQTKKLL